MQRQNNTDRRPAQNHRSAQNRPAPNRRPVSQARPSGTRPTHSRPSASHQAVSYRRRRRSQRKTLRIAVAALILLVAIILILVFALHGHPDAQTAVAPTSTPTPTIDPETTPSATPTSMPTPSPTPEPAYSANAKYRPTAKEGWLPVFRKAETDEKMIAITVDDCFQAENLRTIVQTALDNGAKLTLFPIGDVAVREKQSQIIKWAWENGMEIENHTYTHNGLYNVSNERLAEEIYKQNLAISGILGVEYQGHFLRPRGGDARSDQRIHAYIDQLGYYGVAHWSESGSGTELKSLPGKLKPGAVYLFHTTDKDMEKLVRFIPYAVAQGYRLVTLNEMFGYPDNETSTLKHISEYPTPTLAPFEYTTVTLKNPTYSYAAYMLQEKLIALGYLTGEPDGVFGSGCAKAVASFQKKAGLEATGEADAATQAAIKQAYEQL